MSPGPIAATTVPATATAADGPVRLLIAEDEPLLAAELAQRLQRAWPEARVVAQAGDGHSAVQAAIDARVQVCFLDIRMPGQSGLDAARDLIEDWPPEAGPLPWVVFVTAFDQHAVAAFEACACDYLLKPVSDERLARTVALLKRRLAERGPPESAPGQPIASALEGGIETLRRTLQDAAADRSAAAPARSTSAERLTVIQAAAGSALHLVPVDDVLVFEAADKYVRVLTAGREYLIRTPLRELLDRLDEAVFWQVHRGTVVRATAIEQAVRDDSGRMRLVLRGLPNERPQVSRLYQHRFRAM